MCVLGGILVAYAVTAGMLILFVLLLLRTMPTTR